MPYCSLAIALLAVLSVLGNRMLADWLVGTLEKPFRSVDPLQIPSIRHAVLLGGATIQTATGGVQVNENGDRIVMAARLYHAKKVGKIYCSGARHGNQRLLASDEAEQSRRLLLDLGVACSAIETIGGRNTSEEIGLVAGIACDTPIGIVTSAWHLPRALRLARLTGIEVVPLPCGFLGSSNSSRSWRTIIRGLLPSHRAVMMNIYALREYLAMAVGR